MCGHVCTYVVMVTVITVETRETVSWLRQASSQLSLSKQSQPSIPKETRDKRRGAHLFAC